jgi:hypothetical protein
MFSKIKKKSNAISSALLLLLISAQANALSYLPASITTDVASTKTDLVTIGETVAVLTAVAWGIKSLRKIL